MRATLLGTRGSLASPGPETARYGGNTSTVEVRANNGAMLVLDAGTGIRRLGSRLPTGTSRVDILLTHLHMDHIQGLGFFRPLHEPGVDVHIWGPGSSTLSLSQRLSRYLSPPLFPVRLRDLPAVTCHEIPFTGFDLGPFRIQAALVCHPNPTVGYRIQADAGTLAYLPDHEPILGLKRDKKAEPEWTSGYDLATGADLLIHDAQFTDEEYAKRVGWGHSTYRQALDFATLVGATEVFPFRHDPWHDDAKLDRLLQDARRRYNSGPRISGGPEDAVFEVGQSR